MDTYKIVRFYAPHLHKGTRKVMGGLSLEDAQTHCKDPKTRKEGQWVDGYTKEWGDKMIPENVFNKVNPIAHYSKDELIAQIRDERRSLIPLIAQKRLVLTQLKGITKQIKHHNQTILYLSGELAKLTED